MGSESSAFQRSPVMGINSNVRVGNCQLHVQTEDLGPQQVCIVTHVLADDGQILCVARFDYSHHAGDANLRASLLKAVRAHHLAVIQRLQRFVGEDLAELRDWMRALGPSADSIPPVSLRPSRVVTKGPGTPVVRPAQPKEVGTVSDHDRRLAAVANDEGFNLYRRGDLEGALLCWSRAVDLDPTNGAYQANLRRIRALVDRPPKT